MITSKEKNQPVYHPFLEAGKSDRSETGSLTSHTPISGI